jgi:RNA polymerase sigma factor (TIGR02999 family)
MSDVTRILGEIEQGDGQAAEQLLPIVYEELRKLASHKMAREALGHSLQTTALVHEAYVRLVDAEKAQTWNSRGHFFGAAAEAMRRILVESARRKGRVKHGGERTRIEFDDEMAADSLPSEQLLDIHEALDKLAETDREAAELVSLRYFAGLSIAEVADVLGISKRTVDYRWAYARAWLLDELKDRE